MDYQVRASSKADYLPEFLTLVLFSLESLITKCLIHRVGAVISGGKKRREKIKSRQREHVNWNVTPRRLNSFCLFFF